MSMELPRLVLDLASSPAQLVAAWPDGTVTALTAAGTAIPASPRWDGSSLRPEETAAHGGVDTAGPGLAAVLRLLAQALGMPDSTTELGSDEAEVVAARLFAQLVDEVRAAVGARPGSVAVAVPPAWGPRRVVRLRSAADRAGLPLAGVVLSPVAVGWHLLAGGAGLPVGAPLLVCEAAGDAFRASVVCRTTAGFEVLASVDAATVGAEPAWARAREQDSMRVFDGAAADDELSGLLGEVVVRALAGAEVSPRRLMMACVAGASVDDRVVVAEVRRAAQVEPLRVAEAALGVVLGAAQSPALEMPAEADRGGGVGWRDVVGVAAPAVWSVVLFGQFMTGAQRFGPRERLDAGFLLAAWGGLAFAAVFGLLAAVAGFAVAAAARRKEGMFGGDAQVWVRHRLLALALAGGAGCGVVVAAVYAVLAGGFFDLGLGSLLRWSVLPVLPAAVAVVLLGVAVWRRPDPPDGSWPAWLRFPVPVVVLAGFGAWLISFDETGSPWLLNPLSWQLQQWFPPGAGIIGPVGRLGGLCVGVGVGWLLVRRLPLRLAVGGLLGVLVAGSLAWRVTGAVAVGFAVAVAGWWAARALVLVLRPLLLRPPAAVPPPGSAAAHAVQALQVVPAPPGFGDARPGGAGVGPPQGAVQPGGGGVWWPGAGSAPAHGDADPR